MDFAEKVMIYLFLELLLSGLYWTMPLASMIGSLAISIWFMFMVYYEAKAGRLKMKWWVAVVILGFINALIYHLAAPKRIIEKKRSRKSKSA